jgi:hypothetical protein
MIDIADPADKLGSGYPQLSSEYLMAANPYRVFLADGQCCAHTPGALAAPPGFSGLQSVRGTRVDGSGSHLVGVGAAGGRLPGNDRFPRGSRFGDAVCPRG